MLLVSCLNTNFVFLPVMVIQMEFIMRPKKLWSQYIQPTTISRIKVFIVLLVLALKSFIHI